MGEIEHGTSRGYRTQGCRCALCRAWNAAEVRRWRHRTGVSKRARRPRSVRHGERYTYVRGCRCDACTSANADYQREYARLQRDGVPS